MARDSNGAKQTTGETQGGEVQRWHRAAEDAFEQLGWAIGYLHGIGKHGEARMLAGNRRVIRERVLGQSGQPLPTDSDRASPAGPAQR
jgi:hypothetical protein